MRKGWFWLVLLTLLVLGIYCHFATSLDSSSSSNSTDEASLLAIKAHIVSDTNAILSKNWTPGTSFCTWTGVTCGSTHPDRVIALNLSHMGFSTTIPDEITNLSFLTSLDISHNTFTGSIPTNISHLRRLRTLTMASNQLDGSLPPDTFQHLTNLQSLNLSGNNLVGTIPWSIFNLSSLQSIDFSRNQLSGNLPPDVCWQAPKLEVLILLDNQFAGNVLESLWRCARLRILDLASNNFTGRIPMELGNLTQLQQFNLRANEFTGTIPSSVGNLTNLLVFVIGNNRIHGTIPSEVGQLTNAYRINLQQNELWGEVPQQMFNLSNLRILSLILNTNLTGKIPTSIDQSLPNLQYLYLGGNQFSGTIPNSIANISGLRILNLMTNSFTGYAPTNLGNLRQLQVLELGYNNLQNNLSAPEQDFLSPLTSCKYLSYLNIGHNPIHGALPKSLGTSNLSTSLETFISHLTQISGPIPNEYGNLSQLSWLYLKNNELTGVLPVSLGHNLQRLDLTGNMLQGFIPESICLLGKLFYLDLASNGFSGPLPICIGNMPALRAVYFHNNAFNSTIPYTFWSNKDIETLDLAGNVFTGSLPPEIGSMNGVRVVDLSINLLSGEIPDTFGELQYLYAVNFSVNQFNGSIPESLSNLKDLQFLNLSHNNLSGSIPEALESLKSLKSFDASYNYLTGEIPNGGPFANFTADSFVGNKGLCGASRFNVSLCKRSREPKAVKNKTALLKYILPPIALVVVAAAIVVFILRYRRNRKAVISAAPALTAGVVPLRISYYEILHATSNFDEGNLIGRGSLGVVYKGALANTTVAFKVFNLEIQGALQSFDVECQIMRNIRHRNLVKIITSCSNPDFKAMVMAYMPNGNLHGLLHSSHMFLDISKRLDVMMDVACAVEYLHHGYSTPIIHCDLKPGNILLDEDMVAHVSDFGIAKLLPEEERMKQTKTLGTIGYMAPEYGSSGLVSTKVDTYSYGILLIETFTRKKPTDEMFTEELTMKGWAGERFPNRVMEIVDVDLLNVDERSGDEDRDRMCLTSIIGLGVDCTADLAGDRPDMKDVVLKLNKIRKAYHETPTRGP